MPRGFMPSQHYDDFTLSSAEERSEYEEGAADHDGQHPFPLKSTLPPQFRDGPHQSRSQRPALPRGWSGESNSPEQLRRDFARTSRGEEDVTLSTDMGTALDEQVGPSANARRDNGHYEDDSFIPGVGRGHQKSGRMGASSYSAHRDVLASSHAPMHPSPATALRHERLRETTVAKGGIVQSSVAQDRPALSPLSSSATSDGEDSESGNETSSTSTSSYIMQQQGMLRSKAESTGNHQAFTSTHQSQSPMLNRYERPKLDMRALDELDRAVKKGKGGTTRRQLPDSPSPAPSRSGTPRQRGMLQSRKEEQTARGAESSRKRDARTMREEARGSNGSSGYVAGTTGRKPSDGSSNGRKQAGTEGSTTGETLVNERGGEFGHSTSGEKSPFIKLPSGQRMGRGVAPGGSVYLPDMTGMTSALESPVKTVLGVEHRQIAPSAIQARHIQTSEARLEEFNELAYYVKSVEKNLDQTQKKVLAVEDTSKKCVKEVDALRNEWSVWRETRDSPERVGEEEGGEEEDYEGKVRAMNDHIAQLTNDLHSYRNTMEQMRSAKEEQEKERERRARERQQREVDRRRQPGPTLSSPLKQSRVDEEAEEEATRVEMVALRKQVNKVAREVERLRGIVDGDGARERGPSGKSTRFASTTPAPPSRRSVGVGSQSPFVREEMRSSSQGRSTSLRTAARCSSELDDMRARASSPPLSVRGFSEGVEEDGEDGEGDKTIGPVDVIDESDLQLEGEEDVTVQAQSRAERTFEAIRESKRADGHNEKTCTVCGSKQKSERRRQARKERVCHQLPPRSSSSAAVAQEEEEEEENVFFSLLEAGAHRGQSTGLAKDSKHQAVVKRLLKEHMDEFYHHRLLYCELADELKDFEPEMNRIKRRILAEHVMEAVEGLEFRAKRINMLQAMLGPGHRIGEEAAGEAKERKRRPRDGPPIVDGSSLYRRVVSA